MSELYQLRSIGCTRGKSRVLRDVSLILGEGEFVALCGLNGAGKSTLLEILGGLLKPTEGTCRLRSRHIRSWPARSLARVVSFLPQHVGSATRFRADEIVRMGRFPFSSGWSFGPHDEAACEDAIRRAACGPLRHRYVDQLSGGERQRVFFAAVLAQEPSVLLLDEPGTYIDLPHQIEMLTVLRELCAKGVLCVVAMHDLSLAAAFASRLVLLHDGTVVADGPPSQVLTGSSFRDVYGGHIQAEPLPDGRVRVHYAF